MHASLRVLSCNLRSGKADAAAVTALIERESVDVVCAQELSAALATALSSVLAHGNLGHGAIERGNAIAARNPIAIAPIPMARRHAWVARLEPEHWRHLPTAIDIVNVHIAAPHTWPWFPHPVRRSRQLAALLANRAPHSGTPCAILGDFNSTPAWPVYREMAARYADAALLVARPGVAPPGTWPSLRWPGVRQRLRIDHCFLWQLEALDVRTVDLPGSDHLGLLCELALPASVTNA